MTRWTKGRCHCGAVVFEARDRPRSILLCNCSICHMKGYLHWIIPRPDFRLLTPATALSTYRFGTGVAQHHFCRVCGITPYYIPRSDPDKIDVNARCLDGLDVDELPRQTFDGQNWEQAFARYKGLT